VFRISGALCMHTVGQNMHSCKRILVSLAVAYMFQSFVCLICTVVYASFHELNRSTVAIIAYLSLCARQLFKLSSLFKQHSSNTLIFAAE